MSELFGNPEQLPEPLTTLRHSISNGHRIAVYTAEQMRAYAIAARRAALEEAAKLCDDAVKHWTTHGGDSFEGATASERLAAAIRALADKENT